MHLLIVKTVLSNNSHINWLDPIFSLVRLIALLIARRCVANLLKSTKREDYVKYFLFLDNILVMWRGGIFVDAAFPLNTYERVLLGGALGAHAYYLSIIEDKPHIY